MEINSDQENIEFENCGLLFQIWSKFYFQREFVCILYILFVYINKMYKDIKSSWTYFNEGDFNFAIITTVILLLPSLISAIYFGLMEVIQSKKLCSKLPKFIWKTIFGLALVPRQLVRYLKGLLFIIIRLCSFRQGKPEEVEQIKESGQKIDFLEFFQDFYAGFLQIFFQLYLHLLEDGINHTHKSQPFFTSLWTFKSSILFASMWSVSRMHVAVKRKDDGFLTCTLSFIGWMSMFASRLVVFTLAFKQFPFLFILFIFGHVSGFTLWVYSIATEEWRKLATKNATKNAKNIQINSEYQNFTTNQRKSEPRPLPLAIIVFLFFGLPSLLLWPMMFQLNKKGRPIIFLVVILVENAALLMVWYYFKTESTLFTSFTISDLLTVDENTCLWVVISCTLVAFLFLTFYICCKPENTEQVTLHDIRHNFGEKSYDYGLYYEFCRVIFPLKVNKKLSVELKRLRRGLEN